MKPHLEISKQLQDLYGPNRIVVGKAGEKIYFDLPDSPEVFAHLIKRMFQALAVRDMGDITFLTLDQMQVIIDRLPEWLARYGSREAVAQEIDDWMEWSIDPSNWIDGHPRINLEHWLMGCPREPKTEPVKVASPKTVDNADFDLESPTAEMIRKSIRKL